MACLPIGWRCLTLSDKAKRAARVARLAIVSPLMSLLPICETEKGLTMTEYETPMQRIARRKAKANKCQWFLLCDNPATTTQSHSILGEVPICERCKAKYESLGGGSKNPRATHSG